VLLSDGWVFFKTIFESHICGARVLRWYFHSKDQIAKTIRIVWEQHATFSSREAPVSSFLPTAFPKLLWLFLLESDFEKCLFCKRLEKMESAKNIRLVWL
jgi:hypothetical protein